MIKRANFKQKGKIIVSGRARFDEKQSWLVTLTGVNALDKHVEKVKFMLN